MSLLKYRPDIDGLRAIAVIMVVLFHAQLDLFKGGFVGVDVFFVISGYLITSLILKDLEKGSFILSDFWERRIRRILPALAFVVFATLLLGLLIFLPLDLVRLGSQIEWQSITASNVYFWKQVDYFNTEHELQPLLHTWSLAVEEQFYIVFPLLTIAVWKYARAHLLKILWGLFLLSFLASVWAITWDTGAAFFLLPFRMWELLAGSLLAAYQKREFSWTQKQCEILSWAGLVMVLGAAIHYTEKTSFPGAAALLPCAGAVLLILSGGGRGTFISRALSHKIPVFIGLVSYSWYLWHWVIFCFVEYVLQNRFNYPEKFFSVALSFILAILSWRYVEKPFRKPNGVLRSRRAVFVFALIVLSTMAATGKILSEKKGLPARVPPKAMTYANGAKDTNPMRKLCDKDKYKRLLKNDVCEANPGKGIKPTFILWGDSQADAISPAFAVLSEKYGKNGYLAFKSGCPPILDIRHRDNDNVKPFCVDYNAEHFRFIKNSGIKDVFFVANWTSWVRNKTLYFEDSEWYVAQLDAYENILMAGVQRTVDDLHKIGVRIHFLINTPTFEFDPPRALAINSMINMPVDGLYMGKDSLLKKRAIDIDEFIVKNEGPDFIVYDAASMLCDENVCRAEERGQSLYADYGHISRYGAVYVSPIFEDFFKNRD